ncbi:hypothetical protein MRX96_007461 [Rhipicephalus microplus]
MILAARRQKPDRKSDAKGFLPEPEASSAVLGAKPPPLARPPTLIRPFQSCACLRVELSLPADGLKFVGLQWHPVPRFSGQCLFLSCQVDWVIFSVILLHVRRAISQRQEAEMCLECREGYADKTMHSSRHGFPHLNGLPLKNQYVSKFSCNKPYLPANLKC